MAERTLLAQLIFQMEEKLLNRTGCLSQLPDKASVEEIAQMLSADSTGTSDADRAGEIAVSLYALSKEDRLRLEDTGRTVPLYSPLVVLRKGAPIPREPIHREPVFEIAMAALLSVRPLLLKREDWSPWADTWCGVAADVIEVIELGQTTKEIETRVSSGVLQKKLGQLLGLKGEKIDYKHLLTDKGLIAAARDVDNTWSQTKAKKWFDEKGYSFDTSAPLAIPALSTSAPLAIPALSTVRHRMTK